MFLNLRRILMLPRYPEDPSQSNGRESAKPAAMARLASKTSPGIITLKTLRLRVPVTLTCQAQQQHCRSSNSSSSVMITILLPSHRYHPFIVPRPPGTARELLRPTCPGACNDACVR